MNCCFLAARGCKRNVPWMYPKIKPSNKVARLAIRTRSGLLAILACGIAAINACAAEHNPLTTDSINRFVASLGSVRALAAGVSDKAKIENPETSEGKANQSEHPPPMSLDDVKPFTEYEAAVAKAVGQRSVDDAVAKNGWPSGKNWAEIGDRIAAALMVDQRDQQLSTLKTRRTQLTQKQSAGSSLTPSESRELAAIGTLLQNAPTWTVSSADIAAVNENLQSITGAMSTTANK